ncbi:MAG: hypothetical protein GY895_17345 [Phycisphaera sp.]|nr:hypothetical protein [Phycisphaera sp.]
MHDPRTGLASVLLLGLAASPLLAGGDVTFEILIDGLAYGVSDDGSTVVGQNAGSGFTWSLEGRASIGQLAGIAVSGDGRFIAGDTTGPVGDSAGRYDGDGGWTIFGGLGPSGCDSSLSSAYDISSDGQRCVGLGWNGCSAGAFLWTPGDGMVALPQNGPNSSRADTISGDGTVVGGWDEASNGSRRAAVWNQNPKSGAWTQDLLLAGTPGNSIGAGEVNGANGDGSVVVGSANGSSNASSGAFVYRDDDGLDLLGFLPPISNPYTAGALDVSEDGRIVVGFQREGLGGGQSFRATYWTPETGLVALKDHLISLGADIPANFTLAAAMSMSDDGRVICGWGYTDVFFFQDAWIVVLPGDEVPCPGDFNGDGKVNGADLGLMLVDFGNKGSIADLNGDERVDGADLGLLLSFWGDCP